MGINHRASAISIGVISILFAVISIANNAKFNEDDFLQTLRLYADETHNDNLFKNAESLASFLSIVNKVGIGLAIALIITSAMLFGVVGQYMKDNKDRKYLLLPYIVVSFIQVIVQIVIAIVVSNKFAGAATLVSLMLVFSVIGIAITALFATLMAVYFRFLVRYQGY